VVRAPGFAREALERVGREAWSADPDRIDGGVRGVRSLDCILERVCARDVSAVCDNHDRPARAVVVLKLAGRDDDRVVEGCAGGRVDGETVQCGARIGGRGGAPRQSDGHASERDDAHVVLCARGRHEFAGRRNGVREWPAAHRLRTVERENERLLPAEVDRFVAGDRLAVLPQARRLRPERSDERRAQSGEAARVDGRDANIRRRRHRNDDQRSERDPDQPATTAQAFDHS